MAASKSRIRADAFYWARFLVAVFAILIAATHLSSAIPSGSFHTTASTSNQPAPQPSSGASLLPLWLDIEVVAYTLLAVVYLLGLRSWYAIAVIFNAFNVGIYFLSGIIAIPGITTMAFGGRFAVFTAPLPTVVLIISWIAVLVLGLVLLKYDPGSKLDRLLVTEKA